MAVIDPNHSRYDQANLAWIDDLIARDEPESLNLEFKQYRDDEDVKKALAKAASAFANSDGGCIVWGLAKSDRGEVRRLRDAPIPSVDLVLDRLRQLSSFCTSPPVSGLIHKSIIRTDNTGYVVTLVPASDEPPHMAKADHGKYFKRNAWNSLPMEHFEIADLFGRRARPSLSVSLHSRRGMETHRAGIAEREVRVLVRLENAGRGIARFPFVKFTLPSPYTVTRFGVDRNGGFGLPALPVPPDERRTFAFCGGGDHVIHACSYLDICEVGAKYSLSPASAPTALSIDFVVQAVGLTPFRHSAALSVEQILEGWANT